MNSSLDIFRIWGKTNKKYVAASLMIAIIRENIQSSRSRIFLVIGIKPVTLSYYRCEQWPVSSNCPFITTRSSALSVYLILKPADHFDLLRKIVAMCLITSAGIVKSYVI